MIPKFRVWDKKHKQICEVLQIHFDLGFVNCINEWIRNLYFDDCILMQSTGLKDKYSKEMWQYDLVKVGFKGYEKDIFLIIKCVNSPCMNLLNLKNNKMLYIYEDYSKYYKIIGNAFLSYDELIALIQEKKQVEKIYKILEG